MVGVVVGGGLTYLTQRSAQRSLEGVDERRRVSEIQEARRTEQIRTLTEFIRFAYEAEGVAHARPVRWVTGDDWYRTARPAMDGLRIAEKSVELLCLEIVHEPATAYSHALNQAVWRELDQVTIAEHLEAYKAAFFAAARQSLE
ncbi:hypothetical protein [Frankia sp. CcI49]|uniref:hypothetical protein n=1 Tax=Frankia sp. CcI49 TaxID=1745382 RepID=UPI0018E92942|nr:hypothetical protein [Frankia sp. CcI49]